MRFPAALLAAALLAGCFTPGREIAREQWVVVPAGPDEEREVVARSDYVADVKAGRRTPSRSLSKRPPDLLKAVSPLALAPGEVATFTTFHEPFTKIRVQGAAFEAFWSLPYEVRRPRASGFEVVEGADLHLVGRKPGSGRLLLDLREGGTRTLEVIVSGEPRG